MQYTWMDIKSISLPEDTPKTVSVPKFYQIRDRYFLALGAESIGILDETYALLIEFGLVKDIGAVSIFETDESGIPLGMVDGDPTYANDAICGVMEYDFDKALEELLKVLNSTF